MKQEKDRITRISKDPEINFHSIFFDFTDSISVLNYLKKHTLPALMEIHEDWHNVLEKKLSKLTKNQRKEYDKVFKLRQTKLKRNYKIKDKKVQRIMADVFINEFTNRKVDQFLFEMMIVYLITKFEEFSKNILRLVFYIKPESLKSKKQIEIENIIGKNNVDLIRIATEKTILIVEDEDIQGISEFLNEQFGLVLEKTSGWETFKERFYRRNFIVHNAGIPDEIYFNKIKEKKKKFKKTNDKYVINSLKLFSVYAHKITDFFETKYGIEKFHEMEDFKHSNVLQEALKQLQK